MEYAILLVDTRPEVVEPFNDIDWGEGFSVETCSSGQEALSYLQQNLAHIIFIANQLSDMDGIQLLYNIKQSTNIHRVPVIMLSDEQDHQQRIYQMLEGLDDYMSVPFDPRELEYRSRILLREVYNLSSVQTRSARGFSGNLNEMNLLDLLQTLELGRKTGVVHLQRNFSEALVYIASGLVYDAEYESFVGEDALWRLFTWTKGYFFVKFQSFDREQRIRISSQELMIKGLKILEKWEAIRREFPDFNVVPHFKQDVEEESVNSDWKPIIPLIDGKKNLHRILEASPTDEITTLTAIRDMKNHDLLYEVTPDVEKDTLADSESIFNTNDEVEATQLSYIINNYTEEILHKQEPSKRVRHLYPSLEHERTPKDKERIKPQVHFGKIELQYLKRKLL